MHVQDPEAEQGDRSRSFDMLFNKRDYVAAERYWSDGYIQHSAHIPPGRNGLFNLVRTLPDTLKYENQLIIAEGDYVIAPVGSPLLVGPRPGSPPTSSASRTASSPSTGTCFRTRRPMPNRSAGCRCSATDSPTDFFASHLSSTNQAIGLTMPLSLIARGDEMVE